MSTFVVLEPGQIYGDFEVIGPADPYVSPKGLRQSRTKVRCIHCGEESIKSTTKIKKSARRCHCQVSKMVKGKPKPTLVKDLAGERFGKLTVMYRLKPHDHPYYSGVIWHCKCDCGNECDVQSTKLIRGATVSCGCQKADSSKESWKKARETMNKAYQGGTNLYNISQVQPLRNSSTGVRGVYWNSDKQMYEVKIRLKGIVRHIGYFHDLEDAKAARIKAEKKDFDPVLEDNDWDVPNRKR